MIKFIIIKMGDSVISIVFKFYIYMDASSFREDYGAK